jgi:hypothetical protein
MQIHSVGIDLGKTTFHLVALGVAGEVLVRKDDPLLPLLSQVPVAPSSPALHLVESDSKRQQKPSTLWPIGHAEGKQMLLFA